MCNYKRRSFPIPFVEGHDGYCSSCDTIAWAGDEEKILAGGADEVVMRGMESKHNEEEREIVMGKNEKRIEVNTVFGTLTAEVFDNSEYPSIDISLNVPDEDNEGETYERRLVLVESTPNIPKIGLHSLRVLVYHDDDNEDFTHDFKFYEIPSDESDEVKWEKYLQYIKEWADSSKDVKHLGCAPACYDEWLHAEYLESLNA